MDALNVGMISLAGRPEAEQRLSALAGAVSDLGHQVTVLTRRRAGRAEPPAGLRYEVQELAMGPPTELTESEAVEHLGELLHRLRPVIARGRFDVVHANGWLAGLATQLAATDGPPMVQGYDETDPVNRSDPATGAPVAGSRFRAQRAVLRNACQIIAAHHGHRDSLLREGVPNQRITIVPPGMYAQHAPPVTGSVDRGGRRRVLVCGGGPVTERALTALASLARRSADVQVLTFGSAAEPLTWFDDPGVARLTGEWAGVRSYPTQASRSDRVELLRSVDLVVSGERTGLTYLEAMGLGIPVVALSTESAEAVIDGVTGMHALDPSSGWLIQMVHRLLLNATQRQAMGMAALDRIVGRYSWEQVATETVRVYLRCEPDPGAAQDAPGSADSARTQPA